MVMTTLLAAQIPCFAATTTTAASATAPTRAAAVAKYKWDLSEIYKTRAAFEADLKKIKTELMPKLEAYKGKLNSVESYKAFMSLEEETSRLISKAYVYAYMTADLDLSSSEASEMTQLIEGVYVDFGELTAFVLPELSTMSEADFNKLYNDESLKNYRRSLEIIKGKRAHILSAPEEKIISQFGEILGAPNELYDKITVADYEAPTIIDSKGKKIQLTDAAYSNILETGNRDLRKKAFEAITNSYKGQVNSLTTNYATQVKSDVLDADLRNYDSALAASLANEEIPMSIYSNLVKSVDKNLAYLHKYNAVKKNYFGFDKMYSYDTYLPVSGNVNLKYSYDDGVKLIEKALAPLGKKYVADFKAGIDGRWVDAYSDDNKAGGAYSWGAYDTEPFILMNYDNSLDSVLTLAHEMGHSMNSKYSNEKQPSAMADYPTFTAEVASTVNELMVMDYLIKNAKNDDEKLALINMQIQNIRGTVYVQVMFAEFEQKAHEMVENGQPLSLDALNKLWLDLMKKYNGPSLTVLDSSKYGWTTIPHFYTPFYVYKYATSMSASYSIVNQMKGASKDKAIENYLNFLGSGGSKAPVETLQLAGVDMNSTEPVDSILKYFGDLVNEYDKLLKAKKDKMKKAS